MLWGKDENFYEWSSADIWFVNVGAQWKPTDKLRVEPRYQLQSFQRRSDGSMVGIRKIPRLKVEYQIARPIFVRVVGEYNSDWQDALRDDSRTELPIYIRNGNGGFDRAAGAVSKTFRADWLFSYQPTPGTVLFAGYGNALDNFEDPQSPAPLAHVRRVLPQVELPVPPLANRTFVVFRRRPRRMAKCCGYGIRHPIRVVPLALPLFSFLPAASPHRPPPRRPPPRHPPPPGWTGSFGAGFSLARATATPTREPRLRREARRRDPAPVEDHGALHARQIRAARWTPINLQFDARVDRKFNPRTSVYGQAQYVHDEFKDIDYLVATTVGLGQ